MLNVEPHIFGLFVGTLSQTLYNVAIIHGSFDISILAVFQS
jgi:hypothetical protein